MAIAHNRTKHILTLLAISVVGINLLYLTQIVLDEEHFSYISTISYITIPGFLAAFSIYVAIKEWKNKTQDRFPIVLFTIGITCWFIAEQIWLVFEIIIQTDPFPSFADVFYIIAYPFFIAFLITYLKQIRKHITKNTIIFSGIITGVFLIPTGLVTLDYYGEEATLDIIVGTTYPVLDSILLFFATIGLMYFFRGTKMYFWIMIFIGLLIGVTADTLFLFTAIDESYYNGQLTDILYLIGYFFYIYGIFAFLRIKDDQNYQSEINSITFDTISRFAIPLVIGTVFFIVTITLVYYYFIDESFDQDKILYSLMIGIFAIIGVFIVTIVLISKNVEKFIKLKTTELETQKQDLEILLDKKSEEIIQSSEFSNLGVNLSHIVHDLRNPLSVLKLNIDLLENSDIQNTAVSTRLKSMKEAIQSMNEQMQDVLNYIKKPTVDIVSSGILEIIKKSLNNINVTKDVIIHLPEKDTQIKCDPMKMNLVFTNILANAIDAMNRKGEITITCKTAKNKILIDFSNSGPEIPEENMEKIFEPLFTTKTHGTGLGLPTCKKIILQHQGTISVKNNPTTFTIELPN